jgi:uncharacterized membrane protein YedE/YeeE
MEEIISVTALAGGGLIGVAVMLLALFNGRLLGVSGIAYGLLERQPGEVAWRLAFLAGLLTGGLVLLLAHPEAFGPPSSRSLPATAVAGLLVGFGTRLGNGCTSGHGVCGVSRRSPRSIAATLTFIATGMITVLAVNAWFGGNL